MTREGEGNKGAGWEGSINCGALRKLANFYSQSDITDRPDKQAKEKK